MMLPVASPVVPEDDSTVEERLAIRLIRRFEEVAHVERLGASRQRAHAGLEGDDSRRTDGRR